MFEIHLRRREIGKIGAEKMQSWEQQRVSVKRDEEKEGNL